jgi:hypothetical protein
VQNLGIHRTCIDVNAITKEIEDLIEDEEEDVVCSSLESAVKIMGYLQDAFGTDQPNVERYIAPIVSKVISLA